MFISSFPFSKLNYSSPKEIGQYHLIEHIYAFRGKNNKRYIVVVEEYNYFIYIVKFFLQERKNYIDRFNHLTNLNECSRVLTTIGMIMKEIYSKNPFASFGFIGSHLPNERKENTKRFRLYSRVVRQLISPIAFEHRTALNHSAYLLINKDNQETDLLDKINTMFDSIYLINQ